MTNMPKIEMGKTYKTRDGRPRIKLKYWVNVYKGNPEPWAGGLLFSKDNANSNAAQGRIACIPIEIDCEEGEGLDK